VEGRGAGGSNVVWSLCFVFCRPNFKLLLCPELITIVTVFLWIKGYANFQPTTPVHKKRAVMRPNGSGLVLRCNIMNFNYSENYWRDTSLYLT
jgi:hypothetical protein